MKFVELDVRVVDVQFSTQFGETFSSWMSRHPRLYRVHQWIDVVERAAPITQLLESSQRVLVCLLMSLSVFPSRLVFLWLFAMLC